MKKILHIPFVLLLVIALASCIKEKNPTVLPEGNFTGTFRRLHLNLLNNKIDTINANLTLSLSAATGFAVGGDTTKHAGSKGSYVVDPNFIRFIDSTYPTTGTPAKTHLAGVYQYIYDGKNLQLSISNDTLSYYYNFNAQ